MSKTKRQLETELDAVYAKLELMTKEALMMREIVSIQKVSRVRSTAFG